jgi:hypothetical protein
MGQKILYIFFAGLPLFILGCVNSQQQVQDFVNPKLTKNKISHQYSVRQSNQSKFNFNFIYYIINYRTLLITVGSNDPCDRVCIEGESMVCKYKFEVELYNTLSKVINFKLIN